MTKFYELSDKQVGLTAYFCDPYCSWQKGSIENSNGRLRCSLPRKTDVQNIELSKFNEIIDHHNAMPRKNLGWRTPDEVFAENVQVVLPA